MAYEIKYRITAATKSDVTSIVNIYEDGYDGEIIEYPCVAYKYNTFHVQMILLSLFM